MQSTNEPSASPPPVPSARASTPHRLNVQDASAWVLRVGLALSLVVMLSGVVISCAHGQMSVQRIKHDNFEYRPNLILHGIASGRGESLVELGVYLLVFTPILRVFTSIVVFAAVERDWTYVAITAAVLVLTLAGLLWF